MVLAGCSGDGGEASVPTSSTGVATESSVVDVDGEVVRGPQGDGEEEWLRLMDDDFRDVATARFEAAPDEWLVTVAAMELVSEDPLESELRAAVANALTSVPGVAEVSESDTEVWLVVGDTSGEQLTIAAAGVVDQFADQIVAYLDSLG